MLFNCALEKVIREWSQGRMNGIRMGTRHKGIIIDCLAVADDLVLFSETVEGAKEQITSFQKQAAKVGLQISFEKTIFITNIEPPQNIST